MPADVDHSIVQNLITLMINAHALPDSNTGFVHTEATAPINKAFQFLKGAGLAECLNDQWKLTQEAMQRLVSTIGLEKPTKVFTRRDIPVKDMTTWEILDLLQARGWTHEITRRGILPYKKTDLHGEENKIWYFSRKMDVGNKYVLCLALSCWKTQHSQNTVIALTDYY